MNTSIYQGKNASKLNFNYFSTYKVYGNYGIDRTIMKIEELFIMNDAIIEIAYSIEKFKVQNGIHSHILINTDNDYMFYKKSMEYINPKYIKQGENKKLVKIKKNEKDIKSEVEYKDVYVSVPFINYIGKNKELYIEKIVGNINASIYTYKFCSYGINNGYLRR